MSGHGLARGLVRRRPLGRGAFLRLGLPLEQGAEPLAGQLDFVLGKPLGLLSEKTTLELLVRLEHLEVERAELLAVGRELLDLLDQRGVALQAFLQRRVELEDATLVALSSYGCWNTTTFRHVKTRDAIFFVLLAPSPRPSPAPTVAARCVVSHVRISSSTGFNCSARRSGQGGQPWFFDLPH